jgi:hypothetical protein
VDLSSFTWGLLYLSGFALIGFAFSFHFWRYDSLTVSTATTLPLAPDAASALSAAAMKAVGIRRVSIDATTGSVVGHTGLSLRSLGTSCRVEVRETAEGSSLVCRCRPRAELVLTDWGAGRQVLDALVAEVAATRSAELRELDSPGRSG